MSWEVSGTLTMISAFSEGWAGGEDVGMCIQRKVHHWYCTYRVLTAFVGEIYQSRQHMYHTTAAYVHRLLILGTSSFLVHHPTRAILAEVACTELC
jgi:hypothetical protein